MKSLKLIFITIAGCLLLCSCGANNNNNNPTNSPEATQTTAPTAEATHGAVQNGESAVDEMGNAVGDVGDAVGDAAQGVGDAVNDMVGDGNNNR